MHAFHTNKVDCEYYLSVAVFRRFFDKFMIHKNTEIQL